MLIATKFIPSPLSPLVALSLFSMSVILFPFWKQVHLYVFLKKDSTYKWYDIWLSVWLTSLTVINSRSIQVATNTVIPFFFMTK